MIAFPTNPPPQINDTYTAAGKTWKWTGAVWQLLPRTLTSADITDFSTAAAAAAPSTTNASLLISGTLPDARLSAEVTASLGKANSALQPSALTPVFKYRGSYSTNSSYKVNDVITEEGGFYLCVIDVNAGMSDGHYEDKGPDAEPASWAPLAPLPTPAAIGAASSSHEHSAADITSGTLDIARIPVLPSQKQIVSAGDLTQLTPLQQSEIGQGTVVTTLDGRRRVYTGAGSKVAEASYIVLADITPEWSAIAFKPSFVELASTSGVPDSQATPVSIYIDDFPDGISLNLNSSKVNGKNSYGPTAAGDYPNYTVTIQWNGTAWVMSYTSPYSNGARQFTASGDTLYPWQATWGTDSTGNYGGVEVNRVGTYNAALSAKPLAAEASSGIGAKAAREDHVHPLPTPAQIGAATTEQLDAKQTKTVYSDTAPTHAAGLEWVDTTDLRSYRSYNGAWIEIDRA